MVVDRDRHHEVLNGVGVREQADLDADGSIFLLLAMEICWKGVSFLLLSPLSSSFISFVARHQRRSPEVSAALRRNIF